MSHRPEPGTPPPRGSAPEDLAAQLAALGAPPMPADVTARIGAVLAEEMRHGPPPVRGLRDASEAACAPPPPDRPVAGRRRAAVLAGLVAAAVVTVAALVVHAGAPPAPRAVGEESDLHSAGAGAVGERGAGPLADPARRRACLAAAGVPGPEATLLGGRPYAVAGQPGILLVLGTGVRGRFRLVVVDPACGAGGARLLASTTVGR